MSNKIVEFVFQVDTKGYLFGKEVVCVTGDCKELGSWNADFGIRMTKFNDSYWRVNIKLPNNRIISYRYFVAKPIGNHKLSISYWENSLKPRKLDHKLSNCFEINDTFGLNGDSLCVEKGWLTHEDFIQIHILNVKSMLNDPISLKLLMLPTKDNLLTPPESKIYVHSLDHNEAQNTLQSLYGKQYKNGDYLIFQFSLPKNDLLHYIFVLYKMSDDQHGTIYELSTPYIEKKHESHLAKINVSLNNMVDKHQEFKEATETNLATYIEEFSGNITFEYLIIKPMKNTVCYMDKSSLEQWDKNNPPSFKPVLDIGHRGLGCSFRTDKPANIMENTIASLSIAGEHGADYVEFDVQLTKDLVPILYHDFTVCMVVKKANYLCGDSEESQYPFLEPDEDLIEVGVNQLTLRQLRTLKFHNVTALTNKIRSGKGETVVYDEDPRFETLLPNGYMTKMDVDDVDIYVPSTGEETIALFMEEEKATDTNILSRSFISTLCVFPTLSEVLDQINPDVGFNVEFKYPMAFKDGSHESIDGTYFDMNLYCDTILKPILNRGKERKILFSSFHPDVCLMLRKKQNRYPTLLCFQDENSNKPLKDVRTQKLNMAINFCLSNELLGLSIDAKMMLMEPVSSCVALEVGLILLVWGSDTIDPHTREQLKKMGVQGIIYDRISDFLSGPNVFAKERLNKNNMIKME